MKAFKLILIALTFMASFSCSESEELNVAELKIGDELIQYLESQNVTVNLEIESSQEGNIYIGRSESIKGKLREGIFNIVIKHGAKITSLSDPNARTEACELWYLDLPDGGWAYYYECDGQPHKVSWWTADGEWLGFSYYKFKQYQKQSNNR